MNEVAMIDKNLSVDRTPQLIAIEINSIKEQARKMVLFNSIEIGRRLAEAKLLIKYGEWGEWLEKSVDYSQRTASNLMAIFEQYGSSQITFFCDNAKSQALANLSYTQAVALLGIPQDEREAFIEKNDIDNMSTRELQQTIKEKQDLEARLKEVETGWEKDKKLVEEANWIAKKEREQAQKSLDEKRKMEDDLQSERQAFQGVSESYDRLEKTNQKHYETAERLRKELEEAKVSGNDDEIERLNELLKVSLKRTSELEQQLKEIPVEVTAAEVIEKVPEAIERELAELRQKNKELEAKGAQPISTATIRFKLHFDSLVKGFGDLLGVLDEIDADARDKYKNAVTGLIGKMSERL